MSMPFEGALAVGGNCFTLPVMLDPSQPYLDHHRVGGVPLFGNTMAIEAMATAAALAGFSGKLCFCDIKGPNPCYVPETRIIQAETVRDGDKLTCRIVERLQEKEEIYFSATLAVGCFDLPTVQMIGIPNNTVSGKDIYRLYFHGPAFQVVEKAWLMGDTICASFSGSIPAIFPTGSRPVTAPRLIELCLQTAGLWHIAFSGRMLIPEAIGRIAVCESLDETTEGFVALARKGVDGMDVFLCDASGKVYLEINGYRTAPLPVPVDEAGVQRLKALFRQEGLYGLSNYPLQ